MERCLQQKINEQRICGLNGGKLALNGVKIGGGLASFSRFDADHQACCSCDDDAGNINAALKCWFVG